MTFWQAIVYGILSGITEFVPVSLHGHQLMLKEVFGIDTPLPFLNILLRISFIAAIVVSNLSYFQKFFRTYLTASPSTRRKSHLLNRQMLWDIRLVRGGILPLVILSLLYLLFIKNNGGLLLVAVMLLINGILIYLPEHMAHGNKDSSKMSAMDSVILGASAAVAAVPGLSGIGIGLSYSTHRGADPTKAYHWLLLFGFVANIIFIILDLISIFVVGFDALTFGLFVGYLLASLICFVVALFTIYIMRTWILRYSYVPLAYYCWGAALLTFVVFLTA